jgi:hypothetical protein
VTIICRLSTVVRIAVAAALLGVLLGCTAGVLACRADPVAAGPAPAAQTARDSRVPPDQDREEVRTWRPTRW